MTRIIDALDARLSRRAPARVLPREYARTPPADQTTPSMPRRTIDRMPRDTWDDAGPRFRPPPGVTLFVPVVVALLIQVPAHDRDLGRGSACPPRTARSASRWPRHPLSPCSAARRWPGPTVAVVAALTTADLFVPPDAGPPFIALAFAIIGAVRARRPALGAHLGRDRRG